MAKKVFIYSLSSQRHHYRMKDKKETKCITNGRAAKKEKNGRIVFKNINKSILYSNKVSNAGNVVLFGEKVK